MWLLQSVDEPSDMIIHTTHGEVVISKHKDHPPPKTISTSTVGSLSTLSLCGSSSGTSADQDPWLAADPWGPYNQKRGAPTATPAQDGMKQLADRIQSEVLAKLPVSMDQDHMPERISTLEGQVQMLMNEHQSLENQVNEFSTHSSQQFAVAQQQIQQQSQAFHGQFESHAQGIQAMFTQQMEQIRGPLKKIPRDDTME